MPKSLATPPRCYAATGRRRPPGLRWVAPTDAGVPKAWEVFEERLLYKKFLALSEVIRQPLVAAHGTIATLMEGRREPAGQPRTRLPPTHGPCHARPWLQFKPALGFRQPLGLQWPAVVAEPWAPVSEWGNSPRPPKAKSRGFLASFVCQPPPDSVVSAVVWPILRGNAGGKARVCRHRAGSLARGFQVVAQGRPLTRLRCQVACAARRSAGTCRVPHTA